MPRPHKVKSVCRLPEYTRFGAEGSRSSDAIVLSVEEYETIRLVDREGLDQEAAAELMGVARTTVQRLYAAARLKVAGLLVEGRPLEIAGGDYRTMEGRGAAGCGHGQGRHRRRGCRCRG